MQKIQYIGLYKLLIIVAAFGLMSKNIKTIGSTRERIGLLECVQMLGICWLQWNNFLSEEPSPFVFVFQYTNQGST